MPLEQYIISSVILLLLAYIVFRVIVRRDYKSRGKLSWFGSGSEFIIFALHINFCYSFLNVRWPGWPDMPENQLQKIIGISLFTVGLILTLLSMGYLGFKKAFGMNTDGLINTGIYSYTRNPQLVFYTVLIVGIAVLGLSMYAAIWFILYLIIGYFMVKTEEEHLTEVYGEAYRQYCKNVPRYLIFRKY